MRKWQNFQKSYKYGVQVTVSQVGQFPRGGGRSIENGWLTTVATWHKAWATVVAEEGDEIDEDVLDCRQEPRAVLTTVPNHRSVVTCQQATTLLRVPPVRCRPMHTDSGWDARCGTGIP